MPQNRTADPPAGNGEQFFSEAATATNADAIDADITVSVIATRRGDGSWTWSGVNGQQASAHGHSRPNSRVSRGLDAIAHATSSGGTG